MRTFTIRPLLASDSMAALTAMLHRAFAALGDSGCNCGCVDQKPEMTRQRVARGDCYVAMAGARIVGTVTLEATDPGSAIGWYRQRGVASLHQLGVDPSHQGAGIGQALLRTADAWALRRHYAALALDTPEPARRLHAYYAHHGYSLRAPVQLHGRTYRSVVLSKSIVAPRHRTVPDACAWPPRHPAETALLAAHQPHQPHQRAPARH